MNCKKLSSVTLNTLFAVMLCAMVAAVFSSCNGASTAVSPSSSSTKLLVVNASPDAGWLLAYINNLQIGTNSSQITTATTQTYFKYSSVPTYYGVGSGSLLLQLRSASSQLNLVSITDSIKSGINYSLFCVGLASVDSVSYIFTVDTDKLSSTITYGRGKIRFINASPRTPALSLTANGTTAFSGITYKKISDYVEIPAGNYDFKVTATGAPNSSLVDLPLTTVQNGHLYTIFTKGLVGRTDTAAISLNVITNK
jgi:hypothetical protein